MLTRVQIASLLFPSLLLLAASRLPADPPPPTNGLSANGLTANSPSTDGPSTDGPGADRTSQLTRQLRTDVEFLSSEELKGRGVDDPESIAKAADYIAARMQSIGLKTDWFDGTPFQDVPLTLEAVAGPAERNVVAVHIDGRSQPLVANLADGMNPLAIGSLAGQVSGPLVFVGYGITAPKIGYDDYEGIETAGKIAIILRKEPGASDPDSPFSGTRNTRHAFFNTKIDNAISHGASAIVIVNDPESVKRSNQKIDSRIELEQQSLERTRQQLAELPSEAKNIQAALSARIAASETLIESLQRERTDSEAGIIGVAEAGQRPEGKDSVPVVSVTRHFADQLLQQATGQSLRAIEAHIDQTHTPQSIALANAQAKLQMELKPMVAQTCNVIGVIPGRGLLADESVIVGAHYDHVGMGGFGSLAPGTVAIHNGADDNASGTAALLAIATEAMHQLADQSDHRRIVFIAFTGEERGLIGSKHYVRQPRFPLESTVAMINMDMVGRLRDNELTVYGTGSSPVMNEILDQANQRQQFNLFRVATGYGPSDHQSFYEVKIPVIFFFTGLHNDYHRPSDDFDKINFGGLTRITDTVSNALLQLATRKDRPQYTKTEGLAKIRRQLTAYLGVKLNDRNGRVVLSELTEGGPAARGGLRVGDTIVKLAGKQIERSSDVIEQVREQSPRDKVVARVIRGGNMFDLTIELGLRPDR